MLSRVPSVMVSSTFYDLRQVRADLTAFIVDDTRLLQFIDRIRSVDRVRTHEFETACEIVDTLRIQFAYLMHEGLSWRLKLRQRPREVRVLERLRGEALRIALEQPKAWEYRLFGHVLADEVESHKDLKRDYELNVVLGLGEYLSLADFHPWMQARLSELERLVTATAKLVNEVARDAFGPPGIPGNPEFIVFVARRIGEAYREALEWAQRVRRAAVDKKLAAVVSEFAGFADDIISQLQGIGPRLLAGIDEALARPRGEKQEP